MRFDRFGYGAVAFRDDHPLDRDYMKKMAPSLFAPRAATIMSEKYLYIPTSKVLNALEREAGFVPFAVRVSGAKYRDHAYAKHEIRLRKLGEHANPGKLGGSVRELVVTNSHDGTSSYVLDDGLLRLVCTNGLIAYGRTKSSRVRHVGGEDVVAQLIENALRIANTGKELADVIEAMEARQLSAEERERLAETAIAARWGTEESPVTTKQVLVPRRQADTGNDLWTVFNVLQENIDHGGVSYVKRMKTGQTSLRQSRPIRNIAASQSFNRELWAAAEAFVSWA